MMGFFFAPYLLGSKRREPIRNLLYLRGMWLPRFIDHLLLGKKYSAHTVLAYRRDIQSFSDFCREVYDGQDIDGAEYQMIRNWIVELSASGVSNRSINRKIAALKAYYRFLMQQGAVKTSPLARHRALKTPKKVALPFSPNEMAAVLDETPFEPGFLGVRDKLMIELLYASGIRRAELVGLTMPNVDLVSGQIKVLGKRSKERIIPLLPSTIALFKAYFGERESLGTLVDGSYVFLSKNGHKIYENLVYRVIIRYLGKVSTKVKKSPHMLRHTFATHMLGNGADLNSVKELLGHSSLASTQVYTHNGIEELKKVHANAHPRNKKE